MRGARFLDVTVHLATGIVQIMHRLSYLDAAQQAAVEDYITL